MKLHYYALTVNAIFYKLIYPAFMVLKNIFYLSIIFYKILQEYAYLQQNLFSK